jgi:hypothetical protein
MGTQCPGVYLGNPVPEGYEYGDLVRQAGGVLRIGTIKYGRVPWNSGPNGTALAMTSSNSKLQTRPLIGEGATKYQTRNCPKKISRTKKNWSRDPHGCLTPRRTGRLTVGLNITLTLVLTRSRNPVIRLVLFSYHWYTYRLFVTGKRNKDGLNLRSSRNS